MEDFSEEEIQRIEDDEGIIDEADEAEEQLDDTQIVQIDVKVDEEIIFSHIKNHDPLFNDSDRTETYREIVFEFYIKDE